MFEEVMPTATVVGFTSPSEALEYAGANRVVIAFLDIELGKLSGLDLCRELPDVNPPHERRVPDRVRRVLPRRVGHEGERLHGQTVTAEGVRGQPGRLRFPFSTGEVLT